MFSTVEFPIVTYPAMLLCLDLSYLVMDPQLKVTGDENLNIIP